MKRKQIKDVFTPRNAYVNPHMYIKRELLEKELIRKIKGTQNIVIFGESGCGKSWLYKKVLSDMKIPYQVLNLAYADNHNSILELLDSEAKADETIKIGYTETKSAEIGAYVLKGGLENERQYAIGEKSPLYKYLDRFFENPGFVCFENLEAIFANNNMMKELGNLIILLDDEKFAKYKTKFIIVGVPSGILEYYSKMKNLNTISNRLVEVSEITPMGHEQVKQFVLKGFVDNLKISLNGPELTMLYEHINYITNGIPQSMHEYSAVIADLIEENGWKFDPAQIDQANKIWLKDSLYKNYDVIQQLMNSVNTDIGRRNQVIYCIGKLHSKSFTVADIDELVRKEFPVSCSKTRVLNLNIPLGDISEAQNTFIKRYAKSYYITDMKYIHCIRTMLKKDGEKMIRIDLNDL